MKGKAACQPGPLFVTITWLMYLQAKNWPQRPNAHNDVASSSLQLCNTCNAADAAVYIYVYVLAFCQSKLPGTAVQLRQHYILCPLYMLHSYLYGWNYYHACLQSHEWLKPAVFSFDGIP